MESFSEELFVDEGSEWSPSESSSMSCDLSDDWSMETSAITLNDMLEAMWNRGSYPLWDEIEDKLEQDPRSARVWSHWGLLPLHYALSNSRPELSTIRALIAAYPQALSMPTRSEPDRGEFPLHAASSGKHAPLSVLRIVLYAREEAVKYRSRQGHLPLHAACRRLGNVASVWELLTLYPEGAKAADNNRMTPLDQLMVSCNAVNLKEMPGSIMNKPKSNPRHYCYGAMAMNASIDMDILLWADAQLLLMALHHGKVPSLPRSEAFEDDCFITVDAHGIPGVEKFRALHAAVATGSHQDLIELVSTLYPGQYMELDEDHGRLPLHWACISATHNMFFCFSCRKTNTATLWYRHSSRTRLQSLCENCYIYGLRYFDEYGMDATAGIKFKETDDGFVWLNTPTDMILSYTKNTCASVVERTVAAYLDAAGCVDKYGRLPLHYLILSSDSFQHPESVLAVVEAFPTAMDTRDPKTGLLPVETVAMADALEELGVTTQTEQLDLFYRLLRRNPVYLSGQIGE
jgi:hypothetical protein